MATKKTAAAGRKSVAKATAPRVVEGVSLVRLPMQPNRTSHPVAMFRGDAPAAGETIEFTLENGITYRGKVAEAIEVNGEVMAEFSGPLVQKK